MQFSREIHRSNGTTKESTPSWTITHHSYFIPIFCTTYSLLKDLSHHTLQCTQKDHRAIKSHSTKRRRACFPSTGGKNNHCHCFCWLQPAANRKLTWDPIYNYRYNFLPKDMRFQLGLPLVSAGMNLWQLLFWLPRRHSPSSSLQD